MPVTAKLLQKFSDTFGKEITTELVDWANEAAAAQKADLRELAEQYYVRLYEKLEQRLAAMDAKVEMKFQVMEARLERRLAEFRAELRTEFATQISALRSELIKWMFTLWAGSAVTTVATVWGVVSLLK